MGREESMRIWPFHRPRRLAPREEPGPSRLGLALGGGGARGAAHLGVMAVLEREGVRPDVIAGTSIGAIIGATVAAGVPSGAMLEHFEELRWRDIARPAWRSRLSMLDSARIGRLVERICGVETFEELRLPFAAVACDILTAEPFVFTEGPLRRALVASSAIPGVFEPVRHAGRLLVDGGLVDSLPVDAARALGAQKVIAVDVTPPLQGVLEPKGVRDMVLLRLNLMEQAAASGRERADVVIAPEVSDIAIPDFSQTRRAYDAGVAAAEAALARIRALVGLPPDAAAIPERDLRVPLGV